MNLKDSTYIVSKSKNIIYTHRRCVLKGKNRKQGKSSHNIPDSNYLCTVISKGYEGKITGNILSLTSIEIMQVLTL